MSWEDDHREDGLWEIIDEARESVKEHVAEGTLDPSESRVLHFSDLLSELEAYRDHPDPRITPLARKNIGNTVQSIVSELPNLERIFKAPSGSTISKFESFARHLRSWPQRGSVTLVGLNSQIENLKNALTTVQESAFDQIEKVEKASADAIEKINEEQQGSSKEYQSGVEKLRRDIEELEATLNTTKKSIAQTEEQIEKSLREHRSIFEEDQKRRSEEFSEHLKTELEASQAAREKADEDAKEVLESIHVNKREAEAILGAMAHRSTATDYGKWAEQQRKQAWWWSRLAILLFVLATFAFLESTFHFFTTPPTVTDSDSLWREVLTRLGMTGVVLAGAIYAAKESGDHKKEERSAKARELVLTTMDPFMANIDPSIRELIRTEAARSIFVIRDEEEKEDNDDTNLDWLWKIIQSRKQITAEEKE